MAYATLWASVKVPDSENLCKTSKSHCKSADLLAYFLSQARRSEQTRTAMNFSILPDLIALAILVAVFRAILRQATNERLHLWLAGWILVLIHFLGQFANARKESGHT